MHQKMLAVGVLLRRLIYDISAIYPERESNKWSQNTKLGIYKIRGTPQSSQNLNTGVPVFKKILKFKNTFCIER